MYQLTKNLELASSRVECSELGSSHTRELPELDSYMQSLHTSFVVQSTLFITIIPVYSTMFIVSSEIKELM